MSSISSIGSSVAATSASSSMAMTGSSEMGGAAMTVSNTSSSMTMVSSSVSTMLSSIDSGLAGNETLKMAIALMILQALLGEQKEGGKGIDMMAALAGGMGGQTTAASMLMMSSSSSSISIEQTVSTSQVQQAYAGGAMPSSSGAMNAIA